MTVRRVVPIITVSDVASARDAYVHTLGLREVMNHGWIVTLAGEAGRKLEAFHNTELAAMLIYRESGYHINPARFYDNNETSLADMKRLAEQETANG